MDSIIIVSLIIIFLIQLAVPKARLNNIGLFGFSALILLFVLIFGIAVYESVNQYRIWADNDFGKFLLPPYQDFSYFVFYSRINFFNPYLLSFIVGLFLLITAKYFNRRFGERVFEASEPFLLATGVFASGYPGWFFYIILLLFIGLFISLFHFWRFKESYRLSLYYFWLPAALFTILISRGLNMLLWWQTLKI